MVFGTKISNILVGGHIMKTSLAKQNRTFALHGELVKFVKTAAEVKNHKKSRTQRTLCFDSSIKERKLKVQSVFVR